MARMKKYYVKREVLATSIERAVVARGMIYEISLATDKDQPEMETKVKGFKPKKHAKTN